MTGIVVAQTLYATGGCSNPTSVSWTLTIGNDIHIFSQWVWTSPHFTDTKTVTNSARGLDAGIDFYTHSPSFGSLNGTAGVYEDFNCVERIITSAYFVDTWLGARTTYLVIDTPGSTTPNNDDVFRTYTVGSQTLDRDTGFTSHGSISSGVLNTSARYWRWTGTDSPHGTSGSTTLTLTLGV